MNIQVEKLDSFNYRVTIPDLNISSLFGYSNFLKEDESSMKILIESLSFNLKSQIFEKRKIKNKKFSI
jgi:signal-transduction protein with cAMP-binding, CBS, and nucleotidyltransferase domain